MFPRPQCNCSTPRRTDVAGRSMVFAETRHPAYDHLDARIIMGKLNRTPGGDPKKAGRAMYELAVLEDPPLRVVIGSDAYKVFVLFRSVSKFN